MNNFDKIIDKLEVFIKKYYFFKILKGSMLILAFSILSVLFFSIIEYFNYLDVNIKTIFFYGFLSVLALLILIFIFLPFLSILKLTKNLSYTDAADFISKHFSEINDKLLNALELHNLLKIDKNNSDLLIASINQRTIELSPFNFRAALNYKFLRKRLLFFSLVSFVFLLIFMFSPKVVTQGTTRLLDYSKKYEPRLPFDFVVLNKSLTCEKGKDFILKMRLKGDYLPSEVFIKMGDNTFRMEERKENDLYEFEFRNVNNSFSFNFFADNYLSKPLSINVLPSPILKSFSIDLMPPAYTGIQNSNILNAGDITVPFGTKIKWNFTTENVSQVILDFNGDTTVLDSKNNLYEYTKIFKSKTDYSISFTNDNFVSNEALKYSITVIPDHYPEIELKKVQDSLQLGAYYFMLNISDDYGFKDLKLICKKSDASTSSTILKKSIEIKSKTTNQNVFYYFNFNELSGFETDNGIEYFFELRDNDYISGYKMVRTATQFYKRISKSEIASLSDKYDKSVNNSISQSHEIANEIRNDIENFRKRELSENISNWDKKEFLKGIQKKQLKLQNLLKKSADANKKRDLLNNQEYKERAKILEKQKQIQKLMDQVLDEELKQLLKEIDELSKNFNEKKFENLKDKINLSYKDLNKQLDRNLELLKRYQVEDNVSKISEDIKDLSKQLDKLSDNDSIFSDKSNLKKSQNSIKESFKNLQEQFNKIQKKNSQLKSPYQLGTFNEDFNAIKNQLNELQNNIDKQSNRKTKKSQKKTAKEMKSLSEKMNNMMKKMNSMSLDLNMEQLRQIIDNLSTFSFSQEDNYNDLLNNYKTSPKFLQIVRTQKKLESDFIIIKDSIYSLSTKVLMMSQLLTKESSKLEYDLAKVSKELEKRNGRLSLKLQRQIITSANTLALYLDELMQQMKNQQQNQGSGSKDGSMSKKQMTGLKKQQQKLKKELQNLLEQMRKDNGKTKGKEFGKQLVKTLAEQEVFNKMIDDLQKGKSFSPEAEQKLKEIRKLSEQNVQDLINKHIGDNLLKRNKLIKTRLLDAENAERKQKEDKKRESKEGKKDKIVVPEELKNSLEKTHRYNENLNRQTLKLNKYYQNLTREYFRQLSNEE